MKKIVVNDKQTIWKYLEVVDDILYLCLDTRTLVLDRFKRLEFEETKVTKHVVINFSFNYSTDIGSAFIEMNLDYVPEHLVDYTSKDIVSDTFEIRLEDIVFMYNEQ